MRVRLAPLLLFVWAAGAPARGDDWTEPGYAARHRLVVPARLPPHSDAVLADMTTQGLLRADAADLRVVTKAGQPRPLRVLSVGPGDRVRFLFRPDEYERVHYAYFSNPGARADRKELRTRAGLIADVRDLPPGLFRHARDMFALWDSARKRQGLVIRPRVFEGANPVGPAPRFVARYSGTFVADEAGTYRFFTASSDASLIRIDGRVVACWGGTHPPHAGRFARYGGSLALESGTHSIEYLWVKASTYPPTAVLAWQRPSDRAPWVMPPNAFVRPGIATVGPLERRDAPATADFVWSALNHIEHEGFFAVQVRLAQRAGPVTDRPDCHWIFEDGSTATGPVVRRVFFADVSRRVRLIVAHEGRVLESAQRIGVEPVWTQVRPPRHKALRPFVDALEALDPHTAATDELAAALAFCDDLDEARRIDPLWSELIERPDAGRARGFARIAAAMGTRLQRPPFCSAPRAERALRAALAAATAPEPRARISLELANLLTNGLARPDEAEKVLDALDLRALPYAYRRLARICYGDIHSERGELDEAAREYERAGSTASELDRRNDVRRAAVLHAAEDYVRRGEFEQAIDELGRWLVVQPDERLEPRCLLALARAHAGTGFYPRAFTLYERALRIAPNGIDAPRLLLGLADAHRAAGSEQDAVETEQRLSQRFPYSLEAALIEARHKGIRPAGGS